MATYSVRWRRVDVAEEVWEFPMAEKVVIAALQPMLVAAGDTARVATKREQNSATRLVRVTRVGGVRSIAEDRARVTFECWDANDVAAAQLASRTRAMVQALSWDPAAGVHINWLAEEGGVVRFPDPDTALPRYQHTQLVAITHGTA